MTKLLVSFCNLFPPAPALGLYDGAADSFRWLDLSGVREQIAGATGGCFAHGHCWTILPLPDARCLLVKLDHRFELRQVFYLQDVRDAHSLIPYEDGFLVSDTSRNAITRLDLQGSSVSETVLWRADDRREDTVHVNSVACLGRDIIVSMFGAKPTDGWASAQRGKIINISTREVIASNLLQPHSLSVWGDSLYWLESGTGRLNCFSPASGPHRVTQIDGYVRGLAADGQSFYVAASARRRRSRSQGTLNAPVADDESTAHCWLYRVDAQTLQQEKRQFTRFGLEIFELVPAPAEFDLPDIPAVDPVQRPIWHFRGELPWLHTRFVADLWQPESQRDQTKRGVMEPPLRLAVGTAAHGFDDIGARMREDWNRRAQENALWYCASAVNDDEYRASGAIDVDRSLAGLDRQWLKSATGLEIGCGTGRMTEFLAPLVHQLYAVDVSTEMLERAQARLGVVGNLELLPVSGDNLAEFSDQSFDLVVSYIVLQQIPNPVVRRYFRDIRRILRPNGIFRGQVANIRDSTFSQPPDSDTLSMRSWKLDELRLEFTGWSRLTFDVQRITDSMDHIWITATP